MKKRIVSFILALALCIGNMNEFGYVNAEEVVSGSTEEVQEKVEELTVDEAGAEPEKPEELIDTEELQEEPSKEEATEGGEEEQVQVPEKQVIEEQPKKTEKEEFFVEETDKDVKEETIVDKEWKIKKIVFDKKSPQEVFEEIKISAQVENLNEELQYKIVWQKDNWKKWGILKDFSKESSVTWQPVEAGNYIICVDVKDKNGRLVTHSQPYSVSKANWSYNNMTPLTSTLKCNEKTTFAANMSGNTKGLLYKFVWQKDNWKEWGVISDFSEKKEVTFTPKSAGDYTIIIDIKDLDGKVISKTGTYKVMTNIWKYEGIETNVPSPQEKYSEPIQFNVVTSGENEGLQYKFVWQKDGWKEWGVIKGFSTDASVMWTPKEAGIYTILVDICDLDREVVTKTLEYEITKVKWNFDEVKFSPQEVQKKNKPVEIKAITSGNTKKLQYKYVWMKDNWREWGVIQDYSENSLAVWKTPARSGKYKILVDVKDRDGEVRTKEKDYFVATYLWEPGEININGGVQEQVYTQIPISVSATGETEKLKYKFVWMKDNWKEWGVVKEFDTRNSTTDWIPKTAGKYTIYVDIEDVDGRRETVTKEYSVLGADWKLEKLDIYGSADRFVGDKLKVTAVTNGNTEGLKYKFVCRRGDGWGDWEVVRDFSSDNSIEIPINKDKDYHIYVDIKNQRGITCDAEVTTVRAHKYLSAGTSNTSTSVGKAISLYPNLSGTKGTPQVKYVWMKDNWKEWGLIKDFSTTSSINWTPKASGTYYIYMDVKMNGIVQSKNVRVTVSDKKNGWYYEGGYKFYYKDGVKQLDLDGILPKQSSYYIKVNRKMNTVTVYAKDGKNGYIIPVKRFACSVGLPSTPTPTGTFYTSNKYRWHALILSSYGQYCTRIVGGVLFHSVAGKNMTSYNLNYRDYNKLGQAASHGCVRLTVRDAKWIYDNCPTRTRVTIYDSSISGPLGKPDTIKIPAGQTWDPTDPNI